MLDANTLMPMLMGMNKNTGSGGMDMNAMANMMSAMQGGGQNPMAKAQGMSPQNSATAPSSSGGMDMNAMANMMSAMQGGGQNPMANMLPMLMSMMNGGQNTQQPPMHNTYNATTQQTNPTPPRTTDTAKPQENFCHYYQGENLGTKK